MSQGHPRAGRYRPRTTRRGPAGPSRPARPDRSGERRGAFRGGGGGLALKRRRGLSRAGAEDGRAGPLRAPGAVVLDSSTVCSAIVKCLGPLDPARPADGRAASAAPSERSRGHRAQERGSGRREAGFGSETEIGGGAARDAESGRGEPRSAGLGAQNGGRGAESRAGARSAGWLRRAASQPGLALDWSLRRRVPGRSPGAGPSGLAGPEAGGRAQQAQPGPEGPSLGCARHRSPVALPPARRPGSLRSGLGSTLRAALTREVWGPGVPGLLHGGSGRLSSAGRRESPSGCLWEGSVQQSRAAFPERSSAFRAPGLQNREWVSLSQAVSGS